MSKGTWDLGTYQFFNVLVGSAMIHIAIISFLRWYPINYDGAIYTTPWLLGIGAYFIIRGAEGWLWGN